MNTSDMLMLYNYHYWTIQRILAASARLDPEQFTLQTDTGNGSLRSTLVHTLDSDRAWRMLCHHQTLDYFRTLQDEEIPTVTVLQQRWTEEERAMRDYLAGLTDSDLGEYVRYTTPEGDQRQRLLWHCLFQVVNHGTQHYSEAAVLLTEYGVSPGGLDFTAFLNEQ